MSVLTEQWFQQHLGPKWKLVVAGITAVSLVGAYLAFRTSPPDNSKTLINPLGYDYIVVGAGSAGCALAGKRDNALS